VEDYSNIKKIALAETKDFVAEYVAKQKPVIITDLFKNQEIEKIKSKQDALERWPDLKLKVQLEYMETYKAMHDDENIQKNPKNFEVSEMSYAEYDKYVENNRDTKMMCIEFGTPDEVSKVYNTPEICMPDDSESDSMIDQIFVGNEGNYASLHYDREGFNGLLYQVYGSKRVLLFPHESSSKLIPLDQIGGWSINNFSPKDLKSFLEFTNGVEIILQPGECLYMPVLCWHYVDYLDDCMSISYRFKRKKFVAEVLSYLYPDYTAQGICQKLLTMSSEEQELNLSVLKENINKAIKSGGEDGVKIAEELKHVAMEFHGKLFPELPKPSYTMNFYRHMPTAIPEFLDLLSPDRPRYI